MPRSKDALFYQLYFQQPGVAEAELERDVRQTFVKVLASAPPLTPANGIVGMVPRKGGFLTLRPAPASLPAWLGETDLDFYVSEFERTGFRGGLNWYRSINRNWELLAPYAGAKVTVPALYMVGDRDTVVHFQHRSGYRQFGKRRAATARQNHAPRLRSLDTAGARVGGQRRHDQLPPPVVSFRPSSSLSSI